MDSWGEALFTGPVRLTTEFSRQAPSFHPPAGIPMLRDSNLFRAGALAILLLSSCQEDEIRTYRVAADATSSAPVPSGQATNSRAHRDVSWHAPAAWREENPAPSPGARYRVDSSGQVSVSKRFVLIMPIGEEPLADVRNRKCLRVILHQAIT